MSHPSFTVHVGGGKAAAANESFSGLAKFIQEQAEHYGFKAQDVDALHSQINASESLRGLNDQSLRTAIVNAFEQVKVRKVKGVTELTSAKNVVVSDVIKAMTSVVSQEGKALPERPEMMAKLKQQVAANEANAAAEGIKKGKSWLEGITTAERINGGIWLAGAGLSMLGVYNATRNSTAVDEKGDKNTRWSQVGVAIIQAAIGAGCAYMGVQTLRGQMRF